MTVRSVICDAILGLGSVLAFLAVTLLSMTIAGIFKGVTEKVKGFIEYISRKG